MKWEILILTQPSRSAYLEMLRRRLIPQCEAWPVKVTAKMFDKDLTLGENRQKMVEDSTAEYISFIDDDDLVADNYVARIYPLLDGVDMVGFNVPCYTDGVLTGIAHHSLRYGEWVEDSGGYYRDLSYMTPMRRELVLRVPIEGGVGEDRRWASKLRKLQCVWTEHYINENLYFYYFRTVKDDSAVPRSLVSHET